MATTDTDEDWAYESARQRDIDLHWTDAEMKAAEELSLRQDQELKEIESVKALSPHACHGC